MLKKFVFTASAIAMSVGAFSAPALANEQETAAVADATSGPALWQFGDEDTTIYMLGTIHILPEGTNWLTPTIETALASSDQFVSEIDTSLIPEYDPASGNPPPPELVAIGQMQAEMAALTTGGTVRDLMSAEERTAYEAAMGELGLPVAAFDGFEPWFVAMTMSQIAMMQAGYDASNGVERQLDHLIDGKDRAAFETVEQQFTFFDTLPMESQLLFLTGGLGEMGELDAVFTEMVGEWVEGDPVGLAGVINDQMDDPHLYYNLLTQRNYAWAEWLDERLDQPGTVFVAVGAGHLAGDHSVQDFLAQRGIEVDRVQ